MYNIIVFFLVSISPVLSILNIENIVGQWIPIVSFPEIEFLPLCNTYEVSYTNINCICGNETAPLIRYKRLGEPLGSSSEFPTIIVLKSEEVSRALKKKCECRGKPNFHVVIRYINEKYHVEYETQNSPFIQYTPEEPNTATMLVRVPFVPNFKEINEIISQSDDLKNRSSSLICPSAF